MFRVLVVDDRFEYGQLVKEMGDFLSCETLIVTNFSTAAQQIVDWDPHLLLLDMHLPQDSWEAVPSIREKYDPTQKSLAFCEQTRRHPRLRHTVVIFVSVDNQPEQKELAKSAGAHGYFTKDQFNTEKLEAVINKIREKKNKPSPSKPAIDTPSPESASPKPTPDPSSSRATPSHLSTDDLSHNLPTEEPDQQEPPKEE